MKKAVLRIALACSLLLMTAPLAAEMREIECDRAPFNAWAMCEGAVPGTVLDGLVFGYDQTVDPAEPGMLERLIASVSSEQEDTAECDQVAIDEGFCDQEQLDERVPQFITPDRFTDFEVARIIESLIFQQELEVIQEAQPEPAPMTTRGKGTGKGKGNGNGNGGF